MVTKGLTKSIKVVDISYFACYNQFVDLRKGDKYGALAQLGERHVCTVEVSGSIPLCSTILMITLLSSVFFLCRGMFMNKQLLVFACILDHDIKEYTLGSLWNIATL